ncbi:MAG: TolC family protein [Phycisphaerales bacterium]|nr:TolC family protein [Phycisphaerales bacterium]
MADREAAKLRMISSRFIPGALVVVVGGCATLQPTVRVGEAMDAVEKQTGERPAWLAPWDEAPPAWDGSSVLGVEEAVTLALRNNRALRADLEMIGQADADLVQAGLLQNPRFNLMAMLPDGGGRAMLRSAGFPIQALQELWLIPSREKAAAAALQEAILRVADRAVETAGEVKRVYTGIRYGQRAIELIQANMEIVEQARRQIQTQQASGKATLVEVNVARIRFLRLQSELMGMEAEYRGLKRRLLMLMGFATANDAWSVTPVHEIDEIFERPPSEEAMLSVAEAGRLDLQAAGWALAGAERRIELMRREGWPEVAVGLTFERSPAPRSQNPTIAGRAGNALVEGLRGDVPELGRASAFEPESRDIEWTVGPMIDFELPIFDWNQAQVAKSLHEYRRQRAELEARRQEIAANVRGTAIMYQQSCEQVQFFREAILPEVERNLEVVRESYRAGREEVTIFLQVQEDVIMTRLNALAFVRDALVQRAELEREVGGRLTPVVGGGDGIVPAASRVAGE